jgi:serine/threonine-protein kinase
MISMLGRYKIIGELGQGAMGVVYKAVDPIIDRTVAIKTINLNLSRQELEEYELRFAQEIKAAGRLNHPNIVTIYDVGKTDTCAYMAMEFLEGKELKDLIATGQLQPVADTINTISQVADGLEFAHGQDIVHRDVKPSNIMVMKGGLAKITDFGIARLPNAAVKTMTGLILGSPRYMSPEQVIGKSIDSRSDIFSLGVVLYEALTNIAPFDGDNVNSIMFSTVNTLPPPPSTHNRLVPPMLDLIVAKALGKLVDDRYQTAKELADDLRECRRQMDSGVPAPVLRVGGNSAPPQPRAPATTNIDTATIPLGNTGLDKPATKDDEPGKALQLSKQFDNFDATLRLAAMTNQTDEFKEYITATQKMRAYKGKVEAQPTPQAPKPAPKPVPAPAPQAAPSPAKGEATVPTNVPPQAVRPDTKPPMAPFPEPASNTLPVVAIVVLSLIAIALVVALLTR